MANLHIPLSEKLKNITGVFGLHLAEQPKYTILKEAGDFELREYDPMFVARVTVDGPFEVAREQAFIQLAKYIFGENRPKKNLPMTTPVLMEMSRVNDTHRLTMSFIMPSGITPKNHPTPLDSKIHFQKIPQETWATISYSGRNTLEQMDAKSQELQSWLMANNHKPESDKTLVVAQYDGPNTIPIFRRNEVWMRLWSKEVH